MRDYREDGYQDGRRGRSNDRDDYPRSDGDRYSYRSGYEEGERRQRISEELDREMYGEEE